MNAKTLDERSVDDAEKQRSYIMRLITGSLMCEDETNNARDAVRDLCAVQFRRGWIRDVEHMSKKHRREARS